MSKQQLDAILQLAAEAPPPENPTPPDMRAWFEAINAQTPMAEGVAISPMSSGSWSGEWLRPSRSDGKRLMIYYHGGGFLFGSPRSHRAVTTQLAQLTAAPVLSIDYRLAPEHPAPAAHDDCFDAYRWALQQGFDASSITLAGDSAGGNLALSTAIRARDEGLPLPGCVVMMSPALDLAGDGESHIRLQNAPLLTKELIDLFNRAYVGEGDLRSSLVTPFYSDMAGLPPILIHVGSNELLVDDSLTLAERIEQAGGPVELKVWQDMVHCWQLYGPMLEESMQSMEEIARFAMAHTG
ncbi:MAG: alpha/beta hydrolase [Candidatus Thiodiazotropha sp.]